MNKIKYISLGIIVDKKPLNLSKQGDKASGRNNSKRISNLKKTKCHRNFFNNVLELQKY